MRASLPHSHPLHHHHRSGPRRLLAALGAAVLVTAAAAQPAQAQIGASLFATGGDVWVRFVGSAAGFTSDLYWCSAPSSASCTQFIFRNHTSAPGAEVQVASAFSAGQEVFFGLNVLNTGHWFFTGPGARNPDDLAHFNAVSISDGRYTIRGGFEDLLGGGDLDYDDLLFDFGGVSQTQVPTTPTVVPEPASVVLLGSGLVVLAGVGARNRRWRGPGASTR